MGNDIRTSAILSAPFKIGSGSRKFMDIYKFLLKTVLTLIN
jgi:hypothetical protein